MSSRNVALLVAAFAISCSQVAHMLVYEVRFGAAAQTLQSSGAHDYFPGAVKAGVGVMCAMALTGLVAIGLARLLAGRPAVRDSAPHYLRILAALYTLQLAVFVAQETAEALVAGLPMTSAANLLLWGTLGQLPVALVAAAAVRWLLLRFEDAVAVIRVALSSRLDAQLAVGTLVTFSAAPSREPSLASAAGRSHAKRGPPSSLRISFS